MADNKSKLPDFQEISRFATKFFRDMKNSVCEIMDDYKSKRAEEGCETKPTESTPTEAKPKTTRKKATKKDEN